MSTFLPGVAGLNNLPVDEGNGPIAGYTTNYNLTLTNFDWKTWHNYEWENWVQVDALLQVAIGYLNIRGVWRPNTEYKVAETVLDPDNLNTFWLCDTDHTSGTDWDTDKALYWTERTDTDPIVQSVFGRIGAVVAEADDYIQWYARHDIENTFTTRQSWEGTFSSAIRHTRTDLNAGISVGVDEGGQLWFGRWDGVGTFLGSYARVGLPGEVTMAMGWDIATREKGDNRWRKIADDDGLRWDGEWQQQTYPPNRMVRDGNWLGISTTTTSERPAPVEIAPAEYVYDGSSPIDTVNAKQVISGMRYTNTSANKLYGIDAYRINTVAGNEYTVWLVQQPGTSNEYVQQLLQFTGTNTGWTQFTIPLTYVFPGDVFDLVTTISEPDPVPATFTLSYNYTTPTNAATPSVGTIIHANKTLNEFRINKTDQNGDQSAQLATITVGDVINGAGASWAIQAITDNGTWYNYSVVPAIQGTSDGVQDFVFETVTASSIAYINDVDYWLADPNVQGIYGADVSYDDIVPNDTQYSMDIRINEQQYSADWDIAAYSGDPGIGGGSGGSDVTREELNAQIDYAMSFSAQHILDANGSIKVHNLPSVRAGRFLMNPTTSTAQAIDATGEEVLGSLGFTINRTTYTQTEMIPVADGGFIQRNTGVINVSPGTTLVNVVYENMFPNEAFGIPRVTAGADGSNFNDMVIVNANKSGDGRSGFTLRIYRMNGQPIVGTVSVSYEAEGR